MTAEGYHRFAVEGGVDNQELMRRIAAGDARAFEQLYQQYAGVVLNLCFRLLRDREDAKDLTQEVFVRAFTDAGSFQHRAHPLTWLYRIATNLCLNHLRRKKRQEHYGSVLDGELLFQNRLAPAPERPDEELERQEAQSLVWRALGSLPPAQRAVLVLQKYEGLSCQEIAKVLDCSVGSVQSRLHRAKENLARILMLFLREE